MSLSLSADEVKPAPRTVTVTLTCDGCSGRTSYSADDDFMLKEFMARGWKVHEGKHFGPCCSGKRSAERVNSPSRRPPQPQAATRFR